MALKIRLRRMGRKKAPHYRIVIAESTMPRDGRFVATIGHYNPTTNPMTLKVDREKALHWLGKGAVPTDTANSLLRRAGVFGDAPADAGVAQRAGDAVKAAAGAVAGAAAAAVEAVKHAAAVVVEKVQRDEPAEEAPAAEAPADEAPADEAPADEAPAAAEAPAAETPAEEPAADASSDEAPAAEEQPQG